jgi:hypothetical protein
VTYQAAAATLVLGGPTTLNSQVLTQINANFDSNWDGLFDSGSGYALHSSIILLVPLLTFPSGVPFASYGYQQEATAIAVKYLIDRCRTILLLPTYPTLISF